MNKHISDIGTKKVLQCLSGLLNTKQDAMSEMSILEMMSLWEGDDEEMKYSFDERVVGTWVDGKPLYQKTVFVGPIERGSFVSLGIDTNEVDLLISYEAFAIPQDPDGITLSTDMNNQVSILEIVKDEDEVKASYNAVSTVNYAAGSDCYVTIRYTKKSDNAK